MERTPFWSLSDKQIADNVRTEQIYPPATPEEIDVAATHIFDAPPEGVAADWTMPQNWQAFTPAQHATWRTLFDQQSGALEGYACTDFLRGLDMLRSVAPGVPDFSALNRRLKPATGWEVVAVPGWIPNTPFFEHLTNRRFPAANFLRPPEQIGYSEEPDMFHDIFGHVPMRSEEHTSELQSLTRISYAVCCLKKKNTTNTTTTTPV